MTGSSTISTSVFSGSSIVLAGLNIKGMRLYRPFKGKCFCSCRASGLVLKELVAYRHCPFSLLQTSCKKGACFPSSPLQRQSALGFRALASKKALQMGDYSSREPRLDSSMQDRKHACNPAQSTSRASGSVLLRMRPQPQPHTKLNSKTKRLQYKNQPQENPQPQPLKKMQEPNCKHKKQPQGRPPTLTPQRKRFKNQKI